MNQTPPNVEPDSLEEWFPSKGWSLSLDISKVYVHAAWRNLRSKILFLFTVVAVAAAVVTIIFAGELRLGIRSAIAVVLGIYLLTVLVWTIVRANSSLIFASLGLINHASHQKATIALLEAEVDALKKKKKIYSELYVCNADMYGVAFEDSTSKTNIDASGGATIEYAFRVKATRPGIVAIERWNSLTMDLDPDMDTLGAVEKRENIKKELIVVLQPELIFKTPNSIFWKLRATPEFPVGISVPYEYAPSFQPQAFKMSLEELYETAFDFEWTSQRVSYPTMHLGLEVLLPEGYSPSNTDFDVWNSTRVRVRNRGEYDRLRDDNGAWRQEWKDGRLWLGLDVSYPLLGLTYAITWLPMAIWPDQTD